MISIKKTKITQIAQSENSATYSISPLPKGYGHTFGTILRRILLSSIAGTGITSVKINNVLHEFSTIKGVSDDVLTILLSLKNIAFKLNTIESVELSLRKLGKKEGLTEVYAGDFEKNSKVEIINPEYIITTINPGTEINIVVKIERGYGYRMNNEISEDEFEFLSVDPDFSPIKLVNYTVGTARVGKDTDLDDLQISIITNGTIRPDEALTIALDILQDSFISLRSAVNDILLPEAKSVELEQEARKLRDNQGDIVKKKITLPISEMKLSTRLMNALQKCGITDLMQLSSMTEEDIENIRGLGSKSYLELLDVIKENNIKLKQNK